MIITIGRQYGSGGKEIGEKLAQKLGFAFYDNELLTIAAQKSGLSQSALSEFDETPTSSFIYNMYVNSMSGIDVVPMNQQLAFAQFDAIKEVAKAGDCVIVGRCADYVLRERKDCIHIFIHSDMEHRKKRIVENYNIPEQLSEKTALKQDKKRAAYYNYYSHKKWGEAASYDFTIDSSMLGIDGSVEVLAKITEEFEKAYRNSFEG
ncbi:MAG: cytidylate kinase-like family protein [Ruminococcaceae bacterium]|nr:cytidylate kinase-like family protein [Oscillospiraceae bacterium]